MKNCPNCNAEVEDNYTMCWNCNYDFTQNKIVDFTEQDSLEKKDITCLRCKDVKMKYTGNYKFHEGARVGALGSFFEIFTNRESFDIYICPKCGKAELYAPLSNI